MAEIMARRFDTLPALPGTTDESVQAIVKVLDFVANTESPTRHLLLNWITQEYAVHRMTATNAIQGIERSGLITIRRSESIQLTSLGAQAQKIGFPACVQLLASHFLATFNGLADVLTVLAQASQSLDLHEIIERRGHRFSRWKIGQEVHWLVALQCVDYGESSGHFNITLFGKDLVSE